MSDILILAAFLLFGMSLFAGWQTEYAAMGGWTLIVINLFTDVPAYLTADNFLYPALAIASLPFLVITVRHLLRDNPLVLQLPKIAAVATIICMPFAGRSHPGRGEPGLLDHPGARPPPANASMEYHHGERVCQPDHPGMYGNYRDIDYARGRSGSAQVIVEAGNLCGSHPGPALVHAQPDAGRCRIHSGIRYMVPVSP